jgi:hypothetical protein
MMCRVDRTHAARNRVSTARLVSARLYQRGEGAETPIRKRIHARFWHERQSPAGSEPADSDLQTESESSRARAQVTSQRRKAHERAIRSRQADHSATHAAPRISPSFTHDSGARSGVGNRCFAFYIGAISIRSISGNPRRCSIDSRADQPSKMFKVGIRWIDCQFNKLANKLRSTHRQPMLSAQPPHCVSISCRANHSLLPFFSPASTYPLPARDTPEWTDCSFYRFLIDNLGSGPTPAHHAHRFQRRNAPMFPGSGERALSEMPKEHEA